MKIKETTGEKVFNICNICIMLILMLLALYPILYVLFVSLSSPAEYVKYTGLIWHPVGFSFTAYTEVLKNPNILLGYKNTLFIVIVGVVLNLFMTVLAAYFLSRRGLMFRTPIMLMILFTMYFSGGLVPRYLLVQGLHLTNTLWSLIIPGMISTYNMIIMRTAFAAVPESLEESAKLDGANHIVILFRIMLPLCMPTIAVLVLYYGVAHWNAWFDAMIFLRNKELYPLQLILRQILIENDVNSMTQGVGNEDKEMVGHTIQYAVIVVATAPILCLYPFLQKYFVKGVMVGAVKG